MKIPWLLNRLSKMPLPEMPWRVLEKSKKVIDRRTKFGCPNSSTTFDSKIFLLWSNAKSSDLQELFPESLERHLSVAQAVLENRFQAFGVEVLFENTVQWHLDPITRKVWPDRFWGDIDCRDKNLGGVKFVWEFNRLYFLFSLGICFHLTRDKKYAEKLLKFINSWLEGNPYPRGVNWTSGIEAGVRLANLVWALSFLEGYPFSQADLKAINLFVWTHAIRLHRYPSRYSSANNHLLAEGFGLFAAGLCFPHLPGADKWLAQGRKILDAEASRQILPDGGSFEYSTTYLSFVFDFFLLYRHMCRVWELNYSSVVDERLEAACLFIRSIMDQGGNVPNIGDQDSAVVVDFGLTNQQNFLSILNTGAVLFEKPELAVGGSDLKTWLITGQSPSPTLSTHPTTRQTVLYEHSGLAVIKDAFQGREEVLFVGNAMPLGLAPLYAHGHLDALSFTLSVGGLEFFVDPGTYLYHGGGKWREYFRSTAAHNTVRINKMELSKQTGDFMFGRPYRIKVHELEQTGDEITWRAAHDAYERLPRPVKLSREVVFAKKSGQFLFNDTIRTSGSCFCEFFFHLHPECSVALEPDNVWITRGGVKVCLEVSQDLAIHSFRGSENPLLGWFSKRFNHITETTTIVCAGHLDSSGTFTNKISIV